MKTIEKISLRKEPTEFKRVKIGGSQEASDYIRQFYESDIEIYESFFILLLNRQNQTIGYAKISQGGIVGTVVDIKLILKYVVESLATGVILAHNHPSGNLQPSREDELITDKIKKALTLIDSSLFDHIIMTRDGYTSMADEGLI
jgi:DNA repair protein RadC